jgi:hypothetical protein
MAIVTVKPTHNRYGGYNTLDWSFNSANTSAAGSAYERYSRGIIFPRSQGKVDYYQNLYNSPVMERLAPRPKTLEDFM